MHGVEKNFKMIPARTLKTRQDQGRLGVVILSKVADYLQNHMSENPYWRHSCVEAWHLINLLIVDIDETEVNATKTKYQEALDALDRKK